jgi:BlaI family penicillinase repressor
MYDYNRNQEGQMTPPPQISDAEWEVMAVLWEQSPLTAAEVIDRLSDVQDWHPKTVRTLLGRLVRKGALRFKAESNRYHYRPAFPREKYIREESRSFLQRVFGGEATPMLVQFVRDARLTDDQIEELKAILDSKKEDAE